MNALFEFVGDAIHLVMGIFVFLLFLAMAFAGLTVVIWLVATAADALS